MTNFSDSSLLNRINCIKDPRHHNTRHLLNDMILIALCATISGADSWTQVAEYGRSKIDWFKTFLELPNGIPSHDTFGRLFAKIDPNGFHDFFTDWVQELLLLLQDTENASFDTIETVDGDHGRIETRQIISTGFL